MRTAPAYNQIGQLLVWQLVQHTARQSARGVAVRSERFTFPRIGWFCAPQAATAFALARFVENRTSAQVGATNFSSQLRCLQQFSPWSTQ